jgi:hypothetical protein
LTLDSHEIIANGHHRPGTAPGRRSLSLTIRVAAVPNAEHLFLHGESENGPVFSGTYGLHLFSTCISRRRLRNALIMLIQEMWFATCFYRRGRTANSGRAAWRLRLAGERAGGEARRLDFASASASI